MKKRVYFTLSPSFIMVTPVRRPPPMSVYFIPYILSSYINRPPNTDIIVFLSSFHQWNDMALLGVFVQQTIIVLEKQKSLLHLRNEFASGWSMMLTKKKRSTTCDCNRHAMVYMWWLNLIESIPSIYDPTVGQNAAGLDAARAMSSVYIYTYKPSWAYRFELDREKNFPCAEPYVLCV